MKETRGSQNFPRLANGRIDQSAPQGIPQNPGGPVVRDSRIKSTEEPDQASLDNNPMPGMEYTPRSAGKR
jgi:hypothetical protein